MGSSICVRAGLEWFRVKSDGEIWRVEGLRGGIILEQMGKL